MMQLAVIMLAKWKHLTLRVFLCETNSNSTTTQFDTQDPNLPQMEIFSRMKLEQTLKSLRINAEIVEVSKLNDTSPMRRYNCVNYYFLCVSNRFKNGLAIRNLHVILVF